MVNKTLVVAKRVLIQVKRDRRTLGLILFVPLLMSILFGYVLGGGEVHRAKVLIVDEDRSHLSRIVISKMLESDTFDIEFYSSMSAAMREVDIGRAKAVVKFEKGFTENLTFKKTPKVTIYIDSTEQMIHSGIFGETTRIINESISTRTPIEISQVYAYREKGFEGIELSTPAVLSFILFFLVILLSTLVVVREKTQVTIERIFVSPIRPLELLLGYLISLSILAIIQSTILLSVAIFIFGAEIAGSILSVYAVAAFYAMGSVGLGIFFGFSSRTELQAVQIVPGIALPSMFLGGVLVPVEVLPWFLKPLANLIPVYYAADALRNIMLRGLGMREIFGDLFAILLFVIFSLTLSILNLRKGGGKKVSKRTKRAGAILVVVIILSSILIYSDFSRELDVEDKRIELPRYSLAEMKHIAFGENLSRIVYSSHAKFLGLDLGSYIVEPRNNYFKLSLNIYRISEKNFILKWRIEDKNVLGGFVPKELHLRVISTNSEFLWNDLDEYTTYSANMMTDLEIELGRVYRDSIYGTIVLESENPEFGFDVEVTYVLRYLIVWQETKQSTRIFFVDGEFVNGL